MHKQYYLAAEYNGGGPLGPAANPGLGRGAPSPGYEGTAQFGHGAPPPGFEGTAQPGHGVPPQESEGTIQFGHGVPPQPGTVPTGTRTPNGPLAHGEYAEPRKNGIKRPVAFVAAFALAVVFAGGLLVHLLADNGSDGSGASASSSDGLFPNEGDCISEIVLQESGWSLSDGSALVDCDSEAAVFDVEKSFPTVEGEVLGADNGAQAAKSICGEDYFQNYPGESWNWFLREASGGAIVSAVCVEARADAVFEDASVPRIPDVGDCFLDENEWRVADCGSPDVFGEVVEWGDAADYPGAQSNDKGKIDELCKDADEYWYGRDIDGTWLYILCVKT
ncbi:hypothetical protein [Salininema proteolyticum]|uniref:Septum formation-related domain-containing protein n=1 Tax=Salininema proteolyticum TaxID=1607685 RepID=A0ABV8U321_9ACTN